MSWTDLHPLIQEAGRTTLAVGLLVTLVLLVRRPFARQFGAKAAYALWLVPLVRFVMPPMPGNWSLTGLMGLGQKAVETGTEIVRLPSHERLMTVPPAPAAAPVAPEAGFEAAASTSLLEGASAALLSNLPLILTLIWAFGALLWLGLSLRKQDVFQRLIWDDSETPSDAIMQESIAIAREIGLKSVPRIRISLLCSGPLVTGLKVASCVAALLV